MKGMGSDWRQWRAESDGGKEGRGGVLQSFHLAVL